MSSAYSNPADRPRPSTPLPLLLVSIVYDVTGVVLLLAGITAGTKDYAGLPTPNGIITATLGAIAIAIGIALVVFPGNTVRIIATVWAGLWCLSILGIFISVPVIVILWRSRATADHFAFCDAQRSASRLR